MFEDDGLLTSNQQRRDATS